jgi:hypothetical protein
MRRPFLRTSGSPQAPAIVETPTHYAPTLFCRLAPLFEVVIGSVEPTICLLHSLRNAGAKVQKFWQSETKRDEKIELFLKWGKESDSASTQRL